MNKQQIFEKIALHLIKQGVRSYNEGCKYRGPNGTKCAVGAVLSDHYYRKDMEYKNIDCIIRAFKVPSFIKENVNMLYQLQQYHDSRFYWTENGYKVDELYQYGINHKLNTDFLKPYMEK